MGCGASKLDDLKLVRLCRERKDFIKAAADHRYALATSHVLYFQSLKDVGEALRRFVEEELVIGGSGSESPVLNLPSDRGKSSKSTSTNISCSGSPEHHNGSGGENRNGIGDGKDHGHIELSDGDSELSSLSGSESSINHFHGSPQAREVRPGMVYEENTNNYNPYNPNYGYNGNPGYTANPGFDSGGYNSSNYGYNANPGYGYNYWNPNEVNTGMYFMKKSSTMVPSMVYQEPSASFAYGNYPQYGGGISGYQYPGGPNGQGFDSGSGSGGRNPLYNPEVERPPPPPPPLPEASGWDFIDLFGTADSTYPSFYKTGGYDVGSVASSPDSVEVRRREGIPDLEEETESEKPMKRPLPKGKEKQQMKVRNNVILNSGEGTSKKVPIVEESVRSVDEKETETVSSSFDTTTEEEEVVGVKKGVTFDIDPPSVQEVESSLPSSLTTLSTYQGTKDILDAVEEIRSEFEIASTHGIEVAVMLELGKVSYQSYSSKLKVLSSRILGSISTPTSSYPRPKRPPRGSAKVMKMAESKYGDRGKDFRMKSGNLSSTLERLYAWEKKLYKEVKNEESLRLIYEKSCKKLKLLVDIGAESNKIEATLAYRRKVLSNINVSFRTIDAIGRRIHKLRDEELHPQITELIHGLMRMWKAMLKCHQKQLQAIIESKSRILRANTGIRKDSSFQATVNLEAELVNWCSHFNDWVDTQKSYITCLNGWLRRCIFVEEEVTPDGVVPFSPGRVGAPPIFIICNDWCEQMERLIQTDVTNTMYVFALNLDQLWERQDEKQRRRLKAEYLSKDFEKWLRSLRREGGRLQRERDVVSEKSAALSGSGVSHLDDLKVDLDSLKKRLSEEKVRHKDTVKQVHEAASNSLQAGLIPVFQALRNFTSEALQACKQVRLQSSEGDTDTAKESS